MGRFSDLRQDSSQRHAFWMENVSQVMPLLTDVNEDMMGSKGQIQADFTTSEGPYPHLCLPNACLVYDREENTPCTIGVCVTPEGNRLRLRASIRENAIFWRDVQLHQLETAIRAALLWLIDEGEIEAWMR